jgi:thymidine phosphorylase
VGEISHILDVHPGGGIVLRKKLGDEVKEGEELALLYGEEPNLSKAWEEMKGVFLIE